jgi:serine/threonine protein kinase
VTSWNPGLVVAQRYRLDRCIGAGGMGEVWAAEHVLTKRQVAVKALFGTIAPESRAHQRFVQEARSAAEVGHRAVVEVLDAFVENDTPVLVMELCSGETLGSRLARDGTLGLREAAQILDPIIEAVACAHAKGIAHRDLKPDNIFLAVEHGALAPKVLDFGLAKLLGDRANELLLSTQAGAVIGTPSYMAPEQAIGDKNIDHRVDVWALGVILYQCLSGMLPVEGTSVPEVLSRVANHAITPLEVVAPDLPRAILDLVGRMLARDPDQRPKSLADVLLVLRSPVTQGSAGPLVGQMVGSYRVTRAIGAGGMGEVYEAVHPGIGSRVAIKVLSAGGRGERVERFFAEARAINHIHHANIVNVLDLAFLPDGRPYILMELLSGSSLAQLIAARGPLPFELVGRVARETLAALGAAHRAGVIHRDIKPDNIFVTEAGLVKVLDFGIAKLMPEAAPSSPATRTGVVLGTPHYMAPEQIRGDAIDGRTDLYALGVVLYEAVTGRRPFEGTTSYALFQQHMEAVPVHPRGLRPDLPPALEQGILGALAKDPRHRPPSAEALAAVLAPEAPAAYSTPTVPSSPPISSHPMAYAATAVHTPTDGAASLAPTFRMPPVRTRPRTGRVLLAIGLGIALAAGIAAAIVLWPSSLPKDKAPRRAASAKPSAKPSGTPATPSARPPAPGTAAAPGELISAWPSYEQRAFDATRFAREADPLVRQRVPDAVFHRVHALGVATNGLVDLSVSSSTVYVQWTSASLGRCVMIVLTGALRNIDAAPFERCAPGKPLPLPRCSAAQVMKGVPFAGQAPVQLTYPSLPEGTGWNAIAEISGDTRTALVPDDC